MSKKRKGLHASDKAQKLRYSVEVRHSKNRKKKIEKHTAKHPNDMQAVECFVNYARTVFPYRRNKGRGATVPLQKKFKVIKYAFGYLPKSMQEVMTEALECQS